MAVSSRPFSDVNLQKPVVIQLDEFPLYVPGLASAELSFIDDGKIDYTPFGMSLYFEHGNAKEEFETKQKELEAMYYSFRKNEELGVSLKDNSLIIGVNGSKYRFEDIIAMITEQYPPSDNIQKVIISLKEVPISIPGLSSVKFLLSDENNFLESKSQNDSPSKSKHYYDDGQLLLTFNQALSPVEIKALETASMKTRNRYHRYCFEFRLNPKKPEEACIYAYRNAVTNRDKWGGFGTVSLHLLTSTGAITKALNECRTKTLNITEEKASATTGAWYSFSYGENNSNFLVRDLSDEEPSTPSIEETPEQLGTNPKPTK